VYEPVQGSEAGEKQGIHKSLEPKNYRNRAKQLFFRMQAVLGFPACASRLLLLARCSPAPLPAQTILTISETKTNCNRNLLAHRSIFCATIFTFSQPTLGSHLLKQQNSHQNQPPEKTPARRSHASALPTQNQDALLFA
jgi:hypothetical protein